MNIRKGQEDRKKFIAKQKLMPFIAPAKMGRPRGAKSRRVIWVDNGAWNRLVALAERENSTVGIMVEMMESICMPASISEAIVTNK